MMYRWSYEEVARSSGSSKASQDDPGNLQDMGGINSRSNVVQSSSLVRPSRVKCDYIATWVGGDKWRRNLVPQDNGQIVEPTHGPIQAEGSSQPSATSY
jgi:hypothetical protein